MTTLRPASAASRSPSPAIDEVKDTLRRLIQENAGIPAELIRDESSIEDDLAMDSFSFISVQVAVEDAFQISCEPADLESCKRFDAIAALVCERAADRSPRPVAAARQPHPADAGHRRSTSGKSAARRRRARG
jgi:acyl carrier protein